MGVPTCVALQLPFVSSACFAVVVRKAAILVLVETARSSDGAVIGTNSVADSGCGSAVGATGAATQHMHGIAHSRLE